MPTVIRVPMLINFLTNSHAYGNLGAYTYSEGKSRQVQAIEMYNAAHTDFFQIC